MCLREKADWKWEKQEDSIAGENRSDYKKGTSERIAARGKE